MPLRNTAMYELLYEFLQRPEPFSRYTVNELWTRPYLAQQMLSYHLDKNTDLASRKLSSIDQVVDWIDAQLDLSNKSLCDLGCGPGLYTQRFAGRGAKVTGVDFSSNSLDYANREAEESKLAISYLNADYLIDTLPIPFDIVTLIYCDFCALSPSQRETLLVRIARMLTTDGRLIMDVNGISALDKKEEVTLLENRLMQGFWADSDYLGVQRTFIYPEQSLSLDRYLIVEPDETWQIFNWLQYFTPSSLETELCQSGFEIEQMVGSLTGDKLEMESDIIGVIARKK